MACSITVVHSISGWTEKRFTKNLLVIHQGHIQHRIAHITTTLNFLIRKRLHGQITRAMMDGGETALCQNCIMKTVKS